MKKILTFIFAIITILTTSLGLASCGGSQFEIAIPNDPTNEARALLLLEENNIITLKEGAGLQATIKDIESNPYNIKFREVEAVQLPLVLDSVDYAVINSNYAIPANLNPVTDALAIESATSYYSNILAVKRGNENSPKIKALVAALESLEVKEFITNEYGGAVVSVVENPTNGYDETVNYEELSNTRITVAASPTPHAEILQIAKAILAKKNITLDIKEYDDYIQPNIIVDEGDVDANYFQHLPYLENFNEENKTNLVSVSKIHVEPLGIYGGKQSSLDALFKK